MAIYKKIDRKDVKVADNSIIDHSQLTGRGSYGAHPITAITGLPEKFNRLDTLINNQNQEIVSIKSRASQITITEDTENTGKLVFTDFNGNATKVQGGYLPDGRTIQLDTYEGIPKLTAVALETTADPLSGDDISDEFATIRSILNSQGGYLDSYNFQKSTPTQEELTQYALQDIGISQAEDIWDGTRVINLYNNNTWSWDLGSLSWTNLGNISIISDANNNGLHGLVTGSREDYKGFIDSNAQISINGLPELALQVSQHEDILDNIITNSYSESSDITYSSEYINTLISSTQDDIQDVTNNTTKIADSNGSFAAGSGSVVTANNAIQLGQGTNNTDNTLQFKTYTLVQSDGKIPNNRLTLDATVIENSMNAITSDGVYDAIGGEALRPFSTADVDTIFDSE